MADVNGDGKPDLVINNYRQSSAWMLLNTTSPGAGLVSFAPHLFPAFAKGNYSSFVAVGDFNGDGRPDFAVSNQRGNTFAVLMNSPSLIATGSATATIAGEFRPVSETVNENTGTFSLAVTIPQAASATAIPITVTGTAVSGINYSNLTASPLIIPAGQTTGTITGTLIDDGEYDPVDKTLNMSIGGSGGSKEDGCVHEDQPGCRSQPRYN